MGRRKGQAEKIEFRGLKPEDLALLVRDGTFGFKNRFLGLARLKRWLDSYDLDTASDDGLTYDEAVQMLQSISDYPIGVSREIDRQIEQLNDALAELDEEVEAAGSDFESAREESRRATQGLVVSLGDIQAMLEKAGLDLAGETAENVDVDQRLPVLVTYRTLQHELRRRPFRRELEASSIDRVNGTGQMQGRSISRAAERMGLTLGDARIYAQVTKALSKRNGEEFSVLGYVERSAALQEAFEKVSIRSPEAIWLKTCLGDSSFERLLDVVRDDELRPIIEREVKGESTVDGRRFDYSEASISALKAGDCLVHVRSIGGAKESFELLQALRAFSEVWRHLYRWDFDVSWLRLGAKPDYGAALSNLLLSLSIDENTCRNPALWLRNMVADSIRWGLLGSALNNVTLHEVTPQIWREIPPGVEALLQLFAVAGEDDLQSCARLALYSGHFKNLVDCLEPYFLLLKGREYGFPLKESI